MQDNNSNNINIFSNRGSYRDGEIINKIKPIDKQYFNKVIIGKKVIRDENEIEENNRKTKEMRENHMSDLNEFYLIHKEEIDEKLKENTKKVQIAMVFGYDGTGYHGLSYQLELKYQAIENLIEKLLFQNGLILPSNIGDIKRLKWSHSSRTDKGVHSLSTVISCFLVVNNDIVENDINKEFVDNINNLLPPHVRLFSAIKVKRSFQARKKGIERSYNYMVPQSYLNNIEIDKMNEILSKFVGIHSFHNYTNKSSTYLNINELPINDENSKKKKKINKKKQDDKDEDSEEEGEEDKTIVVSDENCRLAEKLSFRNNPVNVRNIKSFYIEKDAIEIQGKKWYRFVVTGESFILYQIRKMMGFFLAVATGNASLEALDLSINSPFSIRVPTAPPFPLYLTNVKFDSRIILGDNSIGIDDINDHLYSNPYGSIKPLQDQFLQDHLIPRFNQIESETNQFQQFFDYIKSKHNYNLHDIDQLLILNKDYQLEREERKFKKEQFFKERQEKDQLLKDQKEIEKHDKLII